MKYPISFLVTMLALVSCHATTASTPGSDASPEAAVEGKLADAGAAKDASRLDANEVYDAAPPFDETKARVEPILKGREALLRQQVIAVFHEGSARENRIRLSDQKARVRTGSVRLWFEAGRIVASIDWSTQVSWVRVYGPSFLSFDPKGLLEHGNLTQGDLANASYPELSPKLRVKSLADAKRRLARNVHVDLDDLRPETRDDFRLRAEMSFIDLRSGCIYVNYACGTTPIPPDFGEVPCDE